MPWPVCTACRAVHDAAGCAQRARLCAMHRAVRDRKCCVQCAEPCTTHRAGCAGPAPSSFLRVSGPSANRWHGKWANWPGCVPSLLPGGKKEEQDGRLLLLPSASRACPIQEKRGIKSMSSKRREWIWKTSIFSCGTKPRATPCNSTSEQCPNKPPFLVSFSVAKFPPRIFLFCAMSGPHAARRFPDAGCWADFISYFSTSLKWFLSALTMTLSDNPP